MAESVINVSLASGISPIVKCAIVTDIVRRAILTQANAFHAKTQLLAIIAIIVLKDSTVIHCSVVKLDVGRVDVQIL